MDTAATVTILGGLGLFLLGIHHLTEGLKGLAGDSLRRALQNLVAGRLSAVLSGAFFTAVIQSSTAAPHRDRLRERGQTEPGLQINRIDIIRVIDARRSHPRGARPYPREPQRTD